MTLTEDVTILNDKIKANKVQYELDREAAKISVFSSGELEKYEYLTGEDLGYKPDVIQKAKFEYSPLGKVFNKGLDESDKKEGLLKRLKNIEDQSKITKENKNSQLNIKSIGYTVEEELSQEAMNILNKLANQEKLNDYRKLNFKGGNNRDYDFSSYKPSKVLFRAIYYGEILLVGAEREQNEFDNLLNDLRAYRPRNLNYTKGRESLLIKCKKSYGRREMIIDAFKDKIFPLNNPNDFPHLSPRSESPSHS